MSTGGNKQQVFCQRGITWFRLFGVTLAEHKCPGRGIQKLFVLGISTDCSVYFNVYQQKVSTNNVEHQNKIVSYLPKSTFKARNDIPDRDTSLTASTSNITLDSIVSL
jgi:hypothetical protein